METVVFERLIAFFKILRFEMVNPPDHKSWCTHFTKYLQSDIDIPIGLADDNGVELGCGSGGGTNIEYLLRITVGAQHGILMMIQLYYFMVMELD